MADNPDRTSKGHFRKGNKASGKGRPQGARNKRTIYEELLQKHAPDAVKAFIIESVQKRNASLLMYYISKLVPHRGPRLEFDAPKMAGLADMPRAIAQVRSMMADGTLTLDEGNAVIATYLAQGRAIETVELQKQVEEMKAEIAELRQRGDDE
jgi:hypothetical protein